MTPDDTFTALMHRYRESCGSPEAGVNFMPELWARIENKRRRTRVFERAARSLVAAAVALSLVLGAFLAIPSQQQPSTFYSGSFVEQLASDSTSANGTFFEPVRLELTTEQNSR